MVRMVVYGRGSFSQLAEIIAPHRKQGAPFVYIVDACFEGKDKAWEITLQPEDEVLFVGTEHEPKTAQVDQLTRNLKERYEVVSGIIGIGGGSVLDLAKAVALMLANPGRSEDYQGWDLVKKPGVYHVGIPTLSGTGAEVSRTTVLTGSKKKLGINSDYTPFNQVILDPDLIKGVPSAQRFYTGMDCYIHCIESLSGTFLNAFSKSYGEQALKLCKEIFLYKDMWDDNADEKLMMASWHGGMSIAYSQVGVAHALSYGLGFLLGVKHGIGNCIVFDKLAEFYPEGVLTFQTMKEKQGISLPQGICSDLSETQLQQMANVALSLSPLWENAIGKHWKKVITVAKIKDLYRQL